MSASDDLAKANNDTNNPPNLEKHAEGYNKIHDYLLENGQQELAGHLDGLWQEAGRLQQLASNYERQTLPISGSNAQEFQDNAHSYYDDGELQPDPASEDS